MSEEKRTIDRRSLLKLLGSAGATATVVSACGTSLENSVSAEGLSGGKFDKTVNLATAGPGGNKAWKPGDSLNFLPPQDMPTRGASSDALGALPKEKLLHMYGLMNASRKWETTMKDLFLAGKDGN